jgi:hypothetical protein
MPRHALLVLALAACSDQGSGNLIVSGGPGIGGGGGGGSDAGARDGGQDGGTSAIVELADSPGVGPMAADGSSIYWASGAVVYRVAKLGGDKVPVVTAASQVTGLCVGPSVYLSTADGGVWKLGSTLGSLADVTGAGALAVFADSVFVAGAGGIQEIPAGFGTIQFTDSVPAGRLALSPGEMYWIEAFTQTGSIVTTGAGDAPLSEVVIANEPGGTPLDLAVAGGRVFWSLRVGAGGAIHSAPTSGRGVQPDVVLSGISAPGAIASDGTNVYFVSGDAIGRVTTSGTRLTWLARGQSAVELLVDDSYVYWGNADGRIMRAPK